MLQLDMTNYKGSPYDIYMYTDYTDGAQNDFVVKLIGAYLPRHGSTALLVATAFIFSFSVTIADPSVHVLVAQVGSFPDSGINPRVLAILLSGGMGLLVTIAILRILLNIPIK